MQFPNAKPWSETAKAKRFLAALDPADLHVGYHTPVLGDRGLLILGCTEALAKLRSDHVAAMFGMTFLEAERQGRADEYLAAYAAQPEEQDVLAERFGSPGVFAGWGKDEAERLWRAEATRRIAVRAAA